jgi:hypothetical protein
MKTDAQVYLIIMLDIIQTLNKMGLDREHYDRALRNVTKTRLGEEIGVDKLEVLTK